MAWHARLSASQTKQWSECPGSLAALEAFPEERGGSGVFAQEGTCAHALVERCLETGEDPEDYRDRIIEIVHPDTDEEGTSILRKGAKLPRQAHRVCFIVDDDMIEATTVMTDYVRRRLAEMGFGLSDPAGLIEEGALALEKQTNPLPDRDDTGGTADVTITDDMTEIEVTDYKHGKGVYVPIEGNRQLRSYLLGRVLDVFGGVDANTAYRYTVVQPRNPDARAQSDGRDGVLTETITGEELTAFQQELQEAARDVDAARDLADQYMGSDGTNDVGGLLHDLHDNGFVSLGEDGSHCTFCDLKAVCPAWRVKAQELAAVDFDDEPETPDDPDQGDLPAIMRWIPALDKWFRSIEARAKEIAFSGGTVPGYKVVRNNGRRVLRNEVERQHEDGTVETVQVDNEELARIIAEEFDLDPADIRVAEVVETMLTGPKIEALIKGKGSGERKKLFASRFLEYQEGSLTIAPESDRRDAVNVNPADDFEDDFEDDD